MNKLSLSNQKLSILYILVYTSNQMPQYPTTSQSKPKPTPSPILTTCKQRISEGNQLISKALDLDEEIHADSKIDKTRQVERAKVVLKYYLDGGEILKTVLTVESNKLSRYKLLLELFNCKFLCLGGNKMN